MQKGQLFEGVRLLNLGTEKDKRRAIGPRCYCQTMFAAELRHERWFCVGHASATKLVLLHSMISGETRVRKSLCLLSKLSYCSSFARVNRCDGGRRRGVFVEASWFNGREKTGAGSSRRPRFTYLLAEYVCLIHRGTYKLVLCTMRRACLRG
jgi:hypothetical protein